MPSVSESSNAAARVPRRAKYAASRGLLAAARKKTRLNSVDARLVVSSSTGRPLALDPTNRAELEMGMSSAVRLPAARKTMLRSATPED